MFIGIGLRLAVLRSGSGAGAAVGQLTLDGQVLTLDGQVLTLT